MFKSQIVFHIHVFLYLCFVVDHTGQRRGREGDNLRRVRKRQPGLRRLTPAINAAALAQPNTGSGQKAQKQIQRVVKRHKKREWSKSHLQTHGGFIANKIIWDEYSTGHKIIILGLYIFLNQCSSRTIFWEILGNFATIYELSCGEKLSSKSTFVEKKWQIWGLATRFAIELVEVVETP